MIKANNSTKNCFKACTPEQIQDRLCTCLTNNPELGNLAKPLLPAVKELANWIYYEDGKDFYCFDCIQKRVEEINHNKEFSEDINYEGGDECGYFQDYAETEGEYEATCCKCEKPLFTIGFD